MKLLKLSLISTLFFASLACADVAVIVNAKNNTKLNDMQLKAIYLGKIKSFENGIVATTYDLRVDDPSRKIFLSRFLHKTEANLNAYWARMLFSSKGQPPVELGNSQKVIERVESEVGAIGYVNEADVTKSVRVLFVIK